MYTKPCLNVAHVSGCYSEVGQLAVAKKFEAVRLGRDLEHGRTETENQQDYALLGLHERQRPIFAARTRN